MSKSLGLLYVPSELVPIVKEYPELEPLVTDTFGDNVCFVLCDEESYVDEKGILHLDHTIIDVFAEAIFNFFVLSKTGISKRSLIDSLVELLVLKGNKAI